MTTPEEGSLAARRQRRRGPVWILCVDDEVGVTEVVKYHLLKAGYKVDVAHTAEDALEHCKQKEYALMLLDIKMPGKSGLDILQEIRDVSPKTHVIMLTAISGTDSIIKAFKSYASAYITKPFTKDTLLRKVKFVLSLQKLPGDTDSKV
jgi:DNA-binding response OmpR family regulator